MPYLTTLCPSNQRIWSLSTCSMRTRRFKFTPENKACYGTRPGAANHSIRLCLLWRNPLPLRPVFLLACLLAWVCLLAPLARASLLTGILPRFFIPRLPLCSKEASSMSGSYFHLMAVPFSQKSCASFHQPYAG